MKRHIIPRQQLNPPIVIILFWRACHQTECRAIPLNLKRLNLDAIMLDRTKFREPLLEHFACSLLIKLGSCAHIIDASFEKYSALVENIHCNKLPSGTSINSWDEGRRHEKLATIRETTNVTCVIVIMVNCNECWLAHGLVHWWANFDNATSSPYLGPVRKYS